MFSILPKHLFWLKILSLFEQHRSSSFTLALDPRTNDDTRQLFEITYLALGQNSTSSSTVTIIPLYIVWMRMYECSLSAITKPKLVHEQHRTLLRSSNEILYTRMLKRQRYD